MPFGINYAQKQIIDTSTYKNWVTIGEEAITNNGQYIMYIIRNKPIGGNTLVVKSTNSNWGKEILMASNPFFSEDSRYLVFMRNGTDSLIILQLGYSNEKDIKNIKSFKSPKESKRFLAYSSSVHEGEITLYDLVSNKEVVFSNVIDCQFDDNGKILLLKKEDRSKSSNKQSLIWYNLSIKTEKIIWEGDNIEDCIFDHESKQIVFYVQVKKNKEFDLEIWHYTEDKNQSSVLINSGSIKDYEAFTISPENWDTQFNKGGTKLVFSVQKRATENIEQIKNKLAADVDVWTFKDTYLQSEQLSETFNKSANIRLKASIDVLSKKVVLLENDSINLLLENNTTYFLANGIYYPDSYYNVDRIPHLFLISANDGEKIILASNMYNLSSANISPNEKFVTWFDQDSLSYICYNVQTGIKKNISKSIPYPIYDDELLCSTGRYAVFNVAHSESAIRWIAKDQAMLIYDRYDIWKVDPNGVSAPICITNGYGRRNKIVFGIVDKNSSNENEEIDRNAILLLAAYNLNNQDNGFWQSRLNASNDPKLCIMEPYKFFVPRIGEPFQIDIFKNTVFEPLKAKNNNYWLVKRMSEKESPNLFTTIDFKSFKRVSNITQEDKYNWLTIDRITWTMSDGKVSHGLLYKPENFDSTKKYPVIFNYYVRRSDELVHQFLDPDFTRQAINIPTFVSRGYLVFIPDIYYQQGHIGKSVVNSIVSAAKYLSKYKWADSAHFGLQGHSFGGWETNYLVTHSNIWAAACESAGTSNHISSFGQLNRGKSRAGFYETSTQGSHYGIGVTPWTRPDLYIENSPIFNVDKVTTPLLMMHCKDDEAVPFAQAIEMFLGLKRAGKKVWLLQYDKEGHGLMNDKNARDYNIRIFQFFDYYLKAAPAPKWMIEGIPASKKSIDLGYEYEYNQQP